MRAIRSRELKTVLGYVESGKSVSVIGPPGSGRTSLLSAVTDALDTRGIDTLVLRGVRGCELRPYETLEYADRSVRQPSGVAGMVTQLASEFSGGSGVIVVDDADAVDPHTWGLIGSVRARTGVPVVVALPSAAGLEQRVALFDLAGRPVDVPLAPLDFAEFADLIRGLLPPHADPLLVARLFAKSGGVPGLASAMIDVGCQTGSIEEGPTGWAARGRLWNEGLSGVVEQYLGDLGDAARDGAELLSLAGASDCAEAQRLLGVDVLEELENHQLLVGVTSLGRPSVVVSPPLISEYFRNKPRPLRRSRVLEALTGRDREALHERASALADLSAVSGPEPEAVFLRLSDEGRRAALANAREEWERGHTPESAVAYLDLLFEDEGASARVEHVFGATDGTPASEATDRLAWLNVLWLALDRGDFLRARIELRERAERDPSRAHRQRARLEWLDLVRRGRSEEVDARGEPDLPDLPDLPDGDDGDVLRLVRAFRAVVEARPIDARDLLADVADDVRLDGVVDAAILRCWCDIAAGDVVTALETAQVMCAEARRALDRTRLREWSYAAAVAAFLLGRNLESENLAHTVISLGSPMLAQRATYLGGLTLSSLHAARAGREEASRAFAAQADVVARGGVGPLPAMSGVVPRVVLSLLGGDAAGAFEEQRRQAEELDAMGYCFAAAALASYSFQGVGLSVLASSEGLVLRTQGELFRPLHRLDAAMRAGDTEQIVELGEWFESVGRLAQATTAYGEALRIRVESGVGDAGRARELLNRVVAQRRQGDVELQYWTAAAGPRLSPRESEVVRLAAHGVTNQEIASRLGLSIRTVESHVFKSFRKLGVSSRSELSAYFWS